MRLLLDVAQMVEDAGLYGLHIGEHIIMGSRLEAYPYGKFQYYPETPWLDAMVALGAIAARTTRIRISTGVLLTPLRSAVLLAKALVSIEVLSGGRLEPGIGVGWQEEEYLAAGVPWKARYRVFYDGIRACRALWREQQPVSFESPSTSFDGIWCLPRPIQSRMPLIFGVAVTPKSAPLIAELGDGWCPYGLTLEEIHAGVELLRSAFVEAGRSPDELIVRVPVTRVQTSSGRIDIDRSLAQIPEFEAVGATIVGIGPPQGLSSLDEVSDFVYDLGKASQEL